jgi:hypothetical protein
MRRAILTLAAVVLAAAPLGAQDAAATNPGGVYFRLLGGASMPLGDFGDFFNTGWRGAGTIGWQLAGIPIGFDAEVGYDRFGGDDGLDDAAITSGTVNVRWDARSQSAVQFFLSGGLGVYHFNDYGGGDGILTTVQAADRRPRFGVVYEDNGNSRNKFGLNAGAGLLFGRSNTRFFVQASFHSIFTEGSKTNFVPITAGVQFGPPRM